MCVYICTYTYISLSSGNLGDIFYPLSNETLMEITKDIWLQQNNSVWDMLWNILAGKLNHSREENLPD